jgi:hypothetical protein
MMEIYLLRCVSLLSAPCVVGRAAAIRPQLEHKPTWRGHDIDPTRHPRKLPLVATSVP